VIRPRAQGGFVLALERGFAFASERFDTIDVLAPVFGDERLRMNEGGCDPQGRFYCGSMAYDMAVGAGTLYRLDTDLCVRPVLAGLTISNGLEWSRDGQSVFFNDNATGRVGHL
jgi:sugar lactone lactonase YvrE